jgi:hypothetical protein
MKLARDSADGRIAAALRFVAMLALSSVAIAGCSPKQAGQKVVVQGGLPGLAVDAEVTFLGAKAGFLDVSVRSGGRDYRFFYLDAPDCRKIVTGGPGASFSPTGRGGTLSRGEHSCSPAGILNLSEWRKTGGRRQGEGIPRAQASYRVETRADGIALARGRFPLVSRLRVVGGQDIIAVIPDDEACAAVLDSQTASMEYRSSGRNPLTLLSGPKPCPMIGIVFPDALLGEPDEVDDS